MAAKYEILFFYRVNNARVQPADSSGNFQDLEPRSGKLLAEVPISGTKDVDQAVQAAKIAFKSWSKVELVSDKKYFEILVKA